MTQGFGQMRAPVNASGPTQIRPPLRKHPRPVRLSTSDLGNNKPAETELADTTVENTEWMDAQAPRQLLRVVIVEDEAIIAMELEMLLADMDVEVVGVAMNAVEAEALVAAERPDCVTMDINIQGERDGVEAARAIFEKYGIRSIFVSAYSNAETRSRAAPAQPIGWVTKPVETAQLDEMLRRIERDEA